MASTPDGKGYWLAASNGGVFSFGDAGFYGSMGGQPLNQPVVGMAVTPDGGGYWLIAADGGLFAFGDARFHGSMGGQRLDAPIVGMASTRDGQGYWEVAADGGIFAFGDARFHGSMGGHSLNKPVVAIDATPDGGGYWLVASDGGIFTFGDATYSGSVGGQPLDQPVVGMATTSDGGGYWLVANDGGIFSYGNAAFFGSMGGIGLDRSVLALARSPSDHGYAMATSDGAVFTFGDSRFYGSVIGPGPLRVGEYGDSLAMQAVPFFNFALSSADTLDQQYGGTSICSWFDQMHQDATAFRPEAVVLQFDGDAFAPCMDGVMPGTPAYFQRYAADSETAINIFAAVGAHVYIAGTPISQNSTAGWDTLDHVYAAVAGSSPDATYVDAGASVENDGQFTFTLPCLSFEPCTGPVVNGVPSNLVRDPSGTHFCPTGNFTIVGESGYCDVWSSGAFRYGLAMASGVARDFGQ